MATAEIYETNRLYSTSLAELLPDPNQPRKYFDSKSQPYISETLSLASLPQEIRDEPDRPKNGLQVSFMFGDMRGDQSEIPCR